MTNRARSRPSWKVHINVIQRREGEGEGAEQTEQATRDNADTKPQAAAAALPSITAAAAPSTAAAPQIEGAQRSSDDRAQPAECTVQPTDRAFTSDLCAADSSRSVVLESAAAASSPPPPHCVRIGVLALQGAFIEHIACLDRLTPILRAERHVELRSSLVRTASELANCDGLILPGGESTAMRRLLAESPDGLLAALQCWVRADRPLFGTCAGCIMLADRVVAAPPPTPPDDAAADSALSLVPAAADHSTVPSSVSALGGIDMTVARNYFGRQLASFHARDIRLADQELRSIVARTPGSDDFSRPPLEKESVADDEGAEGVFIRAPAILQLGASVRVLATLPHADTHRRAAHKTTPSNADDASFSSDAASEQAVAVRSGRRIATCFHPELTSDLRWHAYFVDIVLQHQMTP